MTMCYIPCPHFARALPEHRFLPICHECLRMVDLDQDERERSLFADFHRRTALRRLLDRVSSLLRRDGHPSKTKPGVDGVGVTRTRVHRVDERAAIAANLCPLPVTEHMDMSFLSRGSDGLTIRRIPTLTRCGCEDGQHDLFGDARWAAMRTEYQRESHAYICGPHCEHGHHTCDDPAVD